MKHRIPFNKPCLIGRELEYIAESVRSGHTSGGGPFMKKCEEFLADRIGAARVLLTTSGTAALEMAALLCDIGPGDEVIMPSYTFVSTANAFVLRGARPVFVDIDPETRNIDTNLIEAAVTDRTRAIVPVHYAGVSCEMDAIAKIAAKHDLKVIEDAAQGLDARFRTRYLGAMGDCGVFSFHETKNVTCGEGGALVLPDDTLVARAEILREKGTDRARFARGEVDKYTWVDVGSSFISSDLLAAYLYGQLEHLDRIRERRKEIHDRYFGKLLPLIEGGILGSQVSSANCHSNHHMVNLLVGRADRRADLIAHLAARGILAVFHYVPLHLSPMGKKLGYGPGDFPVTEDVASRLLRLPIYFDMTDEEVDEVSDAILEFIHHA
jgi:dTDP-4-amino-4,6-dideoxygalactose transaminase